MTIISPLPFTLANGTTADASKVQANFDQIVDDVNNNAVAAASAFHGAVVYASANQAIPTATPTTLSFDTESIDTDGIHSGGAPTRLTVPSGFTQARLVGKTGFAAGTDGKQYGLTVLKNGSDVIPYTTTRQVSNGVDPTFVEVVSPVCTVTAGDYFQLQAYHTDTGSRDAAGVYTWFEIQLFGG